MNWPAEKDIGATRVTFYATACSRTLMIEISKLHTWQTRLFIMLSSGGYYVTYATGNTYEEVKEKTIDYLNHLWHHIFNQWTPELIKRLFDDVGVLESEVAEIMESLSWVADISFVNAIEQRLANRYPQIVQNIKVAWDLL